MSLAKTCTIANAVRYGTARGEYILNLVSISPILRRKVIDVRVGRMLDRGIAFWGDNQNPPQGTEVFSRF